MVKRRKARCRVDSFFPLQAVTPSFRVERKNNTRACTCLLPKSENSLYLLRIPPSSQELHLLSAHEGDSSTSKHPSNYSTPMQRNVDSRPGTATSHHASGVHVPITTSRTILRTRKQRVNWGRWTGTVRTSSEAGTRRQNCAVISLLCCEEV